MRQAPPLVSFAAMRSGNVAERAQIAAVLRLACEDKGFFYLVDHGIDADLVDSVFVAAKRFFALPDREKALVHMDFSPNRRGYEPMRGQRLEAGTPPDLKEGFYLGNELAAGDPRVSAGLFNHAPNQWPARLPGFRGTLDTYFAEMEKLSLLTMQALALALDLPETWFDDFCREPVSNLKLLHYPPMPPNPMPDEKSCGAHTDWGALTFLAQDDVGGLQVWDRAAGWQDAPPVPGAFVINLGDLIARWTNDRFASTLHRVINLSGRERYSVPFFFTGRADHEIACLPNCLGPAKYAPTTALGHLREMHARSYEK